MIREAKNVAVFLGFFFLLFLTEIIFISVKPLQETVMAQLMDEIGLDLSAQMAQAPSSRTAVASKSRNDELVLPSVPGS